MQNEATGGVLGAVGGAMIGLVEFRRDLDRDARNASTKASNALAAASSALSGLKTLVTSGFLLRGMVHRVADFDVGMCYPGDETSQEPSAFASNAPGLPRPVFTEEVAVSPQQWPPSANAYTDTGLLQDPNNAIVGQNVATGMALGFAEVRSFLLGLPGAAHPSSFVQAQYFRCANGLGAALQAIAVGSVPLTASQYKDKFLGVFGSSGPSPTGSTTGLASAIIVDGPAYGNSTAETTLTSVVMPAGFLAVGQVAEILLGEVAQGASTLTTRVRLDGAGGTLVGQKAYTIAAPATLRQVINITRRADQGGAEVYEIVTESDVAVTDSISVLAGVAHTLYLTGAWTAAAVGNTVTVKLAQLRKL